MARRGDVLELAVLGLLQDSPMHGYELRKRLNAMLGSFRAFSYGTLYPCLKMLLEKGWIRESDGERAKERPAHALSGRRGRIVYQLTAEGKERFASLLAGSGSAAWEDEQFDVHFAFFSRTDAQTRLKILEGRRTRMQERLEKAHEAAHRTRERRDRYTLELQRHAEESMEREVRWLDDLIDSERRRADEPRSGSRRTRPSESTREGDS